MDEIYTNLRKHDVKIVYGGFHKEAFYHPATNNIYVSTAIHSNLRKQNLILHEAGHAFLHFNELELYKACKIERRKLEHEAEVFRIDNMVREYVAEYGVDHEINIYNFMDYNRIKASQEEDVRKAFQKEYDKLEG